MPLDGPTLILAFVAVSAALGLPLAWVAATHRGTGALRGWSLALVAGAAGSALLGLREQVPELLAVTAGNALLIVALALVGEAAARACAASFPSGERWLLAGVTPVVLGGMYLASDNVVPRVLYMALVQGYLVARLAWQMRAVRIRVGKAHPASATTLEAVLWLLFAEIAVRTLATGLVPQPVPFFEQVFVATAFLTGVVVVAGGTCVVVWHEVAMLAGEVQRARTVDGESGLPNRDTFVTHLARHLSGGAIAGGVALVRLRPATRERIAPFAEAAALRSLGQFLRRRLGEEAVLGRVGGDQVAVLFRTGTPEDQADALASALEAISVASTLSGNGAEGINGAALLVPCSLVEAPYWQFLRSLRHQLRALDAAEVRILRREDHVSGPRWTSAAILPPRNAPRRAAV